MASKIFQYNIRVLRNSKDMSQELLAEDLGINRSVIGSWDEGRSELNIEQLIKVAKYFKMTVDSLITQKLPK